jgi:hypothetical protein
MGCYQAIYDVKRRYAQGWKSNYFSNLSVKPREAAIGFIKARLTSIHDIAPRLNAQKVDTQAR